MAQRLNDLIPVISGNRVIENLSLQLFFRFWFSEDREALYHEACNDEDRCDGYPGCAVHLFRMKLVGIITFATHHQQKADRHDNYTTKHP